MPFEKCHGHLALWSSTVHVHRMWFFSSSPSPGRKREKKLSEETILFECEKKGKDGESKIKYLNINSPQTLALDQVLEMSFQIKDGKRYAFSSSLPWAIQITFLEVEDAS